VNGASYCREHAPKKPVTPQRQMRNSSEYKTNRKRALVRDGFACRQCGATEHLTVDHFVPLARGGDNSLSNLWTLCTRCHDLKTRDEAKVR
jgi:5-methylcytosine-specific restriction protein A